MLIKHIYIYTVVRNLYFYMHIIVKEYLNRAPKKLRDLVQLVIVLHTSRPNIYLYHFFIFFYNH